MGDQFSSVECHQFSLDDVEREITNEFVECYEKPENRTGATFHMLKILGVPLGVNVSDPRVIAILTAAEEKG